MKLKIDYSRFSHIKLKRPVTIYHLIKTEINTYDNDYKGLINYQTWWCFGKRWRDICLKLILSGYGCLIHFTFNKALIWISLKSYGF